MMRRGMLIVCLGVLMLAAPVAAQISLVDTNHFTLDFTGFTGTGFAPSPAAGQLDSDEILVTGLSDEPTPIWGGSYTAGDFARGTTTGGVVSGGVYAVDVSGNVALMLQPAGSDVTPGAIILRFVNNTGLAITQLGFRYDFLYYNDGPRANSFNVEFSTTPGVWGGIGPLMSTTPDTADASPAWVRTAKGPYILVTDIPDGGIFWVRWFTDDVSGVDIRDELALDNVEIWANQLVPVELQSFSIE